jgi:hypothetical protein
MERKEKKGVKAIDFFRTATPQQIADFYIFLGIQVPSRVRVLIPPNESKERKTH